jgi:hypothetical protein
MTVPASLRNRYLEFFRLYLQQAKASNFPPALKETIQDLCTYCCEIVEELPHSTTEPLSSTSVSCEYNAEEAAKIRHVMNHADYLISLLKRWQSWSELNPNEHHLFSVLESLSYFSSFSAGLPTDESKHQLNADAICSLIGATNNKLSRHRLDDIDGTNGIVQSVPRYSPKFSTMYDFPCTWLTFEYT